MRYFAGLFLLLTLCLTSVAYADNASEVGTLPPGANNGTWTVWGTETNKAYVTEDAVWFGGPGQVNRWDQTTSTLARFDGADGLAISAFGAFAEDGAGASIVAGPEGFYTVGASEHWRFTPFPAAVHGLGVDGVAAHPDGVLWFSHGRSEGPVSRLDTDGWQLYVNAQAAIEADYAQILTTTTDSDIWTVHGSRVWLGYRMYDGVQWTEHLPDPERSSWPGTMIVSTSGTLFVREYSRVFRWDEPGWTFIAYGDTVTPDEQVWEIWVEWVSPSVPPVYALRCTYGCDTFIALGGAFLAHTSIGEEGTIWFFGNNWVKSIDLNPPHAQTAVISDDYPFVGSLDLTYHNELLVFEWNYVDVTSAPHIALKQIDDMGTTAKHDDVWNTHGTYFRLDALNMTPQGNLWSVSQLFYPPYWLYSKPPVHIVGEQPYVYPSWPVDEYVKVAGAFTQGEQLVTFDTSQGVFVLDNRGTFDRFDDDRWRVYPPPDAAAADTAITADVEGASNISFDGRSRAILDSNGGLWYRGDCTVYHLLGEAWQPVLDYCGIFDLLPGGQGEVFGMSTVESVDYVHVIWPNGVVSLRSLEDFVREHRDLALELRHTNGVWAVAPDGAIWYRQTELQPDGTRALQFVRDDGAQQTVLDVTPAGVSRMAVDEYNHVWVVANSRLWRNSPRVELAVTAGVPPLAQAGTTIGGKVQTTATENYSGMVTLTVPAVASGLTVTVTPTTGALTDLPDISVSIAPTSANGVYTFTVAAMSGLLEATDTASVTVVDEVHETHLPVAR